MFLNANHFLFSKPKTIWKKDNRQIPIRKPLRLENLREFIGNLAHQFLIAQTAFSLLAEYPREYLHQIGLPMGMFLVVGVAHDVSAQFQICATQLVSHKNEEKKTCLVKYYIFIERNKKKMFPLPDHRPTNRTAAAPECR